jgi:hypothetical protein
VGCSGGPRLGAFIGAGVERSGRGRRRNGRRWGGFNGRVIRAHHGGLRRDLKRGVADARPKGGHGGGARRRETGTTASVRLEEEEGRSGNMGQIGRVGMAQRLGPSGEGEASGLAGVSSWL